MAVISSTLHVSHLCLAVKTSAQWLTDTPVLMAGEIALDSDTLRLKVGNGSNTWQDLDYTDADILSRLDSLEALVLAQAQYLSSLAQKLDREELS